MPFRVQRKRSSSEVAKERAAVHLSACGGFPEFMPRRGAPRNVREFENSSCRNGLKQLKLLIGLSCGARRREMALHKIYQKKF